MKTEKIIELTTEELVQLHGGDISLFKTDGSVTLCILSFFTRC